ncbi:MAG: hypothetical protein EOP35_02790 [Rubrivivax sp.]|nr:MAG: hypothetical protein EOP35_02790 [Rubrivivax sp.]
MTATTTFCRPGPATKFPGISKFLKGYVLGIPDWETEDLARLKRYAAEGGFKYSGPDGTLWTYSLADAESDLTRVGLSLRWHAIQACMKGENGFNGLLQRSAAYEYWGLRAAHRFDTFRLQDFRAGKRPQYLPFLRLRSAVSSLAHVFLMGWNDWAEAMNRWILTALGNGGYFDADDTSHPRTQFFVLGLLSSHFGLDLPVNPAFAQDEPIYEYLRKQWRADDPSGLTEALLAALDRHTHQSVRSKRNGPAFDLPFDSDWYFPYEVLVVLRLREMAGLDTPSAEALAHPLTRTPLGQLPPLTPVYSEDTLDGVVRRLREEFADV